MIRTLARLAQSSGISLQSSEGKAQKTEDRRLKTSARYARGYTLMEVLIAVTILAMVLTVVLGTQANQVQVGATANQMGTASLLGRAKMLEIESDLMADGFSENEESENGSFRSEGFPGMNWEYVVEPVEIDEGSKEALLGEANSKLFGEGGDGGGGLFTGNAGFASYLPMVVGLLPDYINQIGEKVRKVKLTITWESARGEQSLTLVQYVTNVDADEEEGLDGAGSSFGSSGPGNIPTPAIGGPK